MVSSTATAEILEKEGSIDVYWDNVGGETLDHALNNATIGARFIICGLISSYNGDAQPMKVCSVTRTGPSTYLTRVSEHAHGPRQARPHARLHGQRPDAEVSKGLLLDRGQVDRERRDQVQRAQVRWDRRDECCSDGDPEGCQPGQVVCQGRRCLNSEFGDLG
jgi:hypothetical protein